MSFWIQQPVLTNQVLAKQILPPRQLLEKTETLINECSIKLDYTGYTEINDDLVNNAYEFILENYISSESSRLVYSKELIQYFLKDSILVFFTPRGQKDKNVGLIVGKRKTICIENTPYEMIDVNFLCLVKKLRKLKLAPYLIAVLTKLSVEKLNISLAYYTISARINSPCFGKKQMYHRPVNIAHLVNSGFFKVSIPNYERIYNNFLNTKTAKYLHNILPDKDLIENIETLLLNYNIKTYNIYETVSVTDILTNKAFHSFAFYDNNKLTDFISILRLDSQMKQEATYKNGYLFITAAQTNTLETIINSVVKICKENNIVDVLTLSDIFPKEIYSKIKFTPGTGILNYYIFNMDIITVENIKNGLVTI
jgi:glycylpeptide N-tetradecanoyltransferase